MGFHFYHISLDNMMTVILKGWQEMSIKGVRRCYISRLDLRALEIGAYTIQGGRERYKR